MKLGIVKHGSRLQRSFSKSPSSGNAYTTYVCLGFIPGCRTAVSPSGAGGADMRRTSKAGGGAQAGIAAIDVKKLAAELSLLKLANASALLGIPVAGLDSRDADALLERDGCQYTVQIWRYESADGNYNLPAGLPDIALPQEVAPMPVGDRDLILYKLRAPGRRKDIYTGSAYPPIYRSRSHILISPYPSMAAQVVKSLNRMEGRR